MDEGLRAAAGGFCGARWEPRSSQRSDAPGAHSLNPVLPASKTSLLIGLYCMHEANGRPRAPRCIASAAFTRTV